VTIPPAPREATPPSPTLADLRRAAGVATDARVFLAGPGTSLSTTDLLRLRVDHASARDAVAAELGTAGPLPAGLAGGGEIVQVQTRAADRYEYLLRPDRGRQLSDTAIAAIRERCAPYPDIQLAVGDGLSAGAATRFAPAMAQGIAQYAADAGLTVGTPIVVRQCRVGVINDIGELLHPDVIVLLIGERPGLQTAESLSAYMAYRPHAGHTNAERNLVCNIHDAGIDIETAVRRVTRLIAQLRAAHASGVNVKEHLPHPAGLQPAARPHHRIEEIRP
jgi:ethanolamine ammonia-lyase small subunit